VVRNDRDQRQATAIEKWRLAPAEAGKYAAARRAHRAGTRIATSESHCDDDSFVAFAEPGCVC
jgi:hypothetical protein